MGTCTDANEKHFVSDMSNKQCDTDTDVLILTQTKEEKFGSGIIFSKDLFTSHTNEKPHSCLIC